MITLSIIRVIGHFYNMTHGKGVLKRVICLNRFIKLCDGFIQTIFAPNTRLVLPHQNRQIAHCQCE